MTSHNSDFTLQRKILECQSKAQFLLKEPFHPILPFIGIKMHVMIPQSLTVLSLFIMHMCISEYLYLHSADMIQGVINHVANLVVSVLSRLHNTDFFPHAQY
jgi:hypothetical protein